MGEATFNQRTALFNMHRALGWPVEGIRDMTFEQASTAIDKAKRHIKEFGFKNGAAETDGLSNDCAEW